MDKVSRVGGVASPEVLNVLNYFQEKIETASIGYTVKELGSRSTPGAWTISECVPNRPLFIIIQCMTSTRAYSYIAPLSGFLNGDSGTSTSKLYLLGGSSSEVGANVSVFIPNSTVVSVQVLESSGEWLLHAYQ